MKKQFTSTFGALLLTASFAAAPAWAQVTANFGHGFPAASLHHKAALEFKDEVEKASKGAIEIHVFHSGQLGSAREMFEGLQLGTQEITWVPTARISGFAPQLQLFDLPFLFKNTEFLEKVLDGPVGQQLLDSLSSQQVTGVGFYVDGFKAMTANKPLRTLDDFKGVKFRTMESDIVMSFYRSLGADPVPMDYAEVYNGLQMGTIDGQENPIVLIHDMKFHEVQKNLMVSEHAVLAGVLVYGSQWFEGLSADQQKLLREAGARLVKRQREMAREVEQQDLEAIRKSGTEVIVLNDDEKEALREASLAVRDQYVKAYGGELLEQIDAARAQ